MKRENSSLYRSEGKTENGTGECCKIARGNNCWRGKKGVTIWNKCSGVSQYHDSRLQCYKQAKLHCEVFKLCYFTQSWIYYRLLNRHREHQLCTPNSSDIQIDRRTYWQTDRHTERHTGRKGGTQKAGHTGRRTDGRTHQAHLPREKYKQV